MAYQLNLTAAEIDHLLELAKLALNEEAYVPEGATNFDYYKTYDYTHNFPKKFVHGILNNNEYLFWGYETNSDLIVIARISLDDYYHGIEFATTLNNIDMEDLVWKKPGVEEHEFTPHTISGVTFTKAKWILNDNHFSIILQGKIAAGTTLAVEEYASFNVSGYGVNITGRLPQAIFGNYISINDVRAYYQDWNSIGMQFCIGVSGNNIILYHVQNPTAQAEATFNFQVDFVLG